MWYPTTPFLFPPCFCLLWSYNVHKLKPTAGQTGLQTTTTVCSTHLMKELGPFACFFFAERGLQGQVLPPVISSHLNTREALSIRLHLCSPSIHQKAAVVERRLEWVTRAGFIMCHIALLCRIAQLLESHFYLCGMIHHGMVRQGNTTYV